jgi:hypothetical protein
MRENVMYVPTPLGVLKVETHPDAAHPAVWVKFIPAGDPSSREQFVSSTVFSDGDIVTEGYSRYYIDPVDVTNHEVRWNHFDHDFDDAIVILKSDDTFEFLMLVCDDDGYRVVGNTIRLTEYLDGEKRPELDKTLSEHGAESVEAVRSKYGVAANQMLASYLADLYNESKIVVLFRGSKDDCEDFITDYVEGRVPQ